MRRTITTRACCLGPAATLWRNPSTRLSGVLPRHPTGLQALRAVQASPSFAEQPTETGATRDTRPSGTTRSARPRGSPGAIARPTRSANNSPAVATESCAHASPARGSVNERHPTGPRMAKSIALAAAASRLASLLLSYIPAVCAFVAPRQPGASTAIIDRLSHSRALRRQPSALAMVNFTIVGVRHPTTRGCSAFSAKSRPARWHRRSSP